MIASTKATLSRLGVLAIARSMTGIAVISKHKLMEKSSQEYYFGLKNCQRQNNGTKNLPTLVVPEPRSTVFGFVGFVQQLTGN